jgi:hypothetical protein
VGLSGQPLAFAHIGLNSKFPSFKHCLTCKRI